MYVYSCELTVDLDVYMYIYLCLVWVYGISTIVSYLMPNSLRVCSLFTCHIETIKRRFTHYRKHRMYRIYYLTIKRVGNHSTELNGLEKLLKHQHIVGKLAPHCKTLKSGLSKKVSVFLFDCLSDKRTALTLNLSCARSLRQYNFPTHPASLTIVPSC